MPAEQLDRIEKRLDTLTAGQHILKTDVAELKTDVAELKTDVASLHLSAVRQEAMHDEIRQLAESMAMLGDRMDRGFQDVRREIREAVAPLTHAIAGHSAQLLDHEGRISTLESRRN